MIQRETCANGSMHLDDRDDNDDEQVIRMNWSTVTLSAIITVLINLWNAFSFAQNGTI